jgi:hypothetical protein
MRHSSLPKLNLALGGGGAHVLAHIVVLKVLEKAGLPIGFQGPVNSPILPGLPWLDISGG